ncbi:antitoxin VbhA family protein [Dactylosporangium sucinum]|uniref:antitoxin VbhA family protein n=1 Tax=Dactylosporangium sucinum TaxID=1424081 RepID=UPI00167D7E6A
MLELEGLTVDAERVAARRESLTQAAASVRAEGLTISCGAEAILERWARGELDTESDARTRTAAVRPAMKPSSLRSRMGSPSGP